MRTKFRPPQTIHWDYRNTRSRRSPCPTSKRCSNDSRAHPPQTKRRPECRARRHVDCRLGFARRVSPIPGMCRLQRRGPRAYPWRRRSEHRRLPRSFGERGRTTDRCTNCSPRKLGRNPGSWRAKRRRRNRSREFPECRKLPKQTWTSSRNSSKCCWCRNKYR